MIHDAIYSLYSKASTINGNTKDTITVLDKDSNKISIDWTNVEAKAKELQTKYNQDIQDESTNKTSGKQKLKDLGLTDAEIKALTGA